MNIGLARLLKYPVVCNTLGNVDKIKCESLKNIMIDKGGEQISHSIWIETNLIARGFCGKAIEVMFQHDRDTIMTYMDDHLLFKDEEEMEDFKLGMRASYTFNSFNFGRSASHLIYKKLKTLIDDGILLMSKNLAESIMSNYWREYTTLLEVAKMISAHMFGFTGHFEENRNRLLILKQEANKQKKLNKTEKENIERIDMLEKTEIYNVKATKQIEISDIDIDVDGLL